MAVKFCLKGSKTWTEAVEMVHRAYGDEALMRANIFRWYGWFSDWQEDVEGNPISGHLSESRSDFIIERIQQTLLVNRRLTLIMMADEHHTSEDIVRKIVVGVRPDRVVSDDWFLLDDNAPCRNVTIVKQFLAYICVTVLNHPFHL